MIVFFNKKTGNIYAVIDGRIHRNPELEWVQNSDMKKGDVGKLVIQFLPAGKLYLPDFHDKQLILDFESRVKNIYDYKIKTDKDGNVLDFVIK